MIFSAHDIISSSHTTFCSKVNINSTRIFENLESCVPSPTPMSLCATSPCCWVFRLLTMISSQFHQLADIYVVVLQFLQHFLHCRFVRVFASKRHINIRCKQIIGCCKICISFTCNWIKCDLDKIHKSLPSSHSTQNTAFPFQYISLMPFLFYRHSIQLYYNRRSVAVKCGWENLNGTQMNTSENSNFDVFLSTTVWFNFLIKENKWYVNCFSPFFSLAGEHSDVIFDTSVVLPQLLLVKDRLTPGHHLQVWKIFVTSSKSNFHVQTSGLTEHFMQLRGQSMILDNLKISFNFLFRVSFDNLKFFNQNIHKTNFDYWRNVKQHQQTACCLFTVAGTSHMKWTYVFILCTLYSSANGGYFSL